MLRSKGLQIYDHLAFTWLDLPLDICLVVVVGEGDGDDREGKKRGEVVVVGSVIQ